MVVNSQSDKALKEIHRVARINRKPEMIKKITLEVLESQMYKEIRSCTTTFTAYNLLRTPASRKISICLMFVC
ncbi:Solute carrier family 22 member 6-A-like [Arapaima gigas]